MRYLSSRTNESTPTDNTKGSLAELAFLSSVVDNFFEHIIARTPLDSPIKFRKADNSTYEENHDNIAGTHYQNR